MGMLVFLVSLPIWGVHQRLHSYDSWTRMYQILWLRRRRFSVLKYRTGSGNNYFSYLYLPLLTPSLALFCSHWNCFHIDNPSVVRSFERFSRLQPIFNRYSHIPIDTSLFSVKLPKTELPVQHFSILTGRATFSVWEVVVQTAIQSATQSNCMLWQSKGRMAGSEGRMAIER